MAKKTVTVTLQMSELLYDIENKTWLTGRQREDADNYKGVAHMVATSDSPERNEILRQIESAKGSLRNHLSEWLGDAFVGSITDTLPEQSGGITFVLQLPSNYNPSINSTIADSMHDYIVNISIGNWFRINDKDDSEEYFTLAAANLNELDAALFKRVRPVRSS